MLRLMEYSIKALFVLYASKIYFALFTRFIYMFDTGSIQNDDVIGLFILLIYLTIVLPILLVCSRRISF